MQNLIQCIKNPYGRSAIRMVLNSSLHCGRNTVHSTKKTNPPPKKNKTKERR